MIRTIKLTLLLIAATFISGCAPHSRNTDEPLFQKFSVKPILKKQNDVNTSTSTNPLSNYELDGVVGTATVNLSD